MQAFVDKMGGDTARNQALFFLQEDPSLVQKLQNAKDPAEAQQYMNQAWRFAGYNEAGGEAGDRIATAQKLVPAVQTPETGFLSSVAPEGDGRFTTADVDAAPTAAVPEVNPLTQFPAAPEAPAPVTSKADQFKTSLGQLGRVMQAMKPPNLLPPEGTAPAPSQGSFNRDPNALKAIMAMLTNMGQSSGPQSLGQLMGGGR